MKDVELHYVATVNKIIDERDGYRAERHRGAGRRDRETERRRDKETKRQRDIEV